MKNCGATEFARIARRRANRMAALSLLFALVSVGALIVRLLGIG